jgi:hypothetical protein
MTMHDTLTWHAHARVEKWTDEQAAHVRATTGILKPSGDLLAEYARPEVVEADGNLLTTAGLTRLTSLLTGGGGQAATNTATRLGVGDGSTGALVGDTDLSAASGASHRYFQVMDATYPTLAAGVVTFKATYDASTANFVWSEWSVDVGSPTVTGGTTVNACLLNHKSSAALGTKSGGIWALTATITVA